MAGIHNLFLPSFLIYSMFLPIGMMVDGLNSATASIDMASLLSSSSLLLSRRDAMAATTFTSSAPSLLLGVNNVDSAASSLTKRLSLKDPSLLSNKLFNLPPSAQVYPPWLRGTWRVDSTTFAGFVFPSKAIPKETIVANPTLAGFQKLSIINLPDIGSTIPPYQISIDPSTGLEDRAATFRSLIDAALSYKAVQQVKYDPTKNPNRISIDFVDYRTTNAERVELFCNARESSSDSSLFCCAEYVRQVTFGTGRQVGIPRQVVTNYANFYTYQRQTSSDSTAATAVLGNLLTAAYLDPQDPLYFQEPSKPVVVYSHNFRFTRSETGDR